MTYDKAQLASELANVTIKIVNLAHSLSEEQLSKQVYAGGWSAQQVFAHLASFDYARMLRGWLRQAKAESKAQTGTGGFDSEAWNQREVAARADRNLQEILAEISARRTATVDLVNNTPQEDLDLPFTTSYGMAGTVGSITYAMAIEHELAHLDDIERALKQ